MTKPLVIRQKRKSISIKIDHKGCVIVKAPNHATEKQIMAFVDQKSSWINKTLSKLPVPVTFKENDKILYLGEEYFLEFSSGKSVIEFSRYEKKLFIHQKFRDKGRERVVGHLKKQARKKLKERLDQLSREHKLPYKKFKLSSAKTRWGSCSGENNINLNWTLIMAPKEVSDYVIIHELVHTKIKDHSKSFWEYVENLCPNYKKHKKWLNDNQFRLVL